MKRAGHGKIGTRNDPSLKRESGMMEFIRNYQSKPWPKLEIPLLRRRQIIGLALFTILFMALGWAIYLNPATQIMYFALMGLVVPIAFFLKSRYAALIGILALQVLLAFAFLGNQIYVVLFVAGLVGAIIAFESQILMYVLLIAAVWFDKSLFAIGHPLRVETIIVAGLLIGWAFKAVQGASKASKTFFYLRLPALLLFSWIVAGFLIWCPSRVPEGWFQLKGYIVGILFFLITPLLIRSEKELRLVMWTWIFAGLVAALATIYAHLTGFQVADASQAASGAAMLAEYKNPTAGFISYSFFAAMAAFYWEKDSKAKWLLGIILAVLLFTLLILQSRLALMGVMFGFAIFWIAETFLNSEKRGALRVFARLLIPIAVGCIFLLGILYLDVIGIIGFYGELFQSPEQITSMQFRLVAWETVYDILRNEGHIIRGLGVGAFYVFAFQYGFPYSNFLEDNAIFHPHSLYLDMILHLGIIGLLFFSWMMLVNILRLWQCYLRFAAVRFRYVFLGLLCGLLAFCFRGTMDGALFGVGDWWLNIGLVAAAINIGINRSESEGTTFR